MSPWLKRIELQTGARTIVPLRPDQPFVVVHVTDHEGLEFGEHVMCDGQSWFHVRHRAKTWLLHGSLMSSGSALYVFMEHPEARHAELEAALPRDAHASEVYADWLEEQGDPFAAALKPALAKARGPAGLWWLEGFERSGAVRVTMRDGFVREAAIGPIQSGDLISTVHRLCHLRACVALERLTIDPRALGVRDWGTVFSWGMWTDCQWPRSLRTLFFTPRLKGLQAPSKLAVRAFQAKVSVKHPQLVVET